MASLTWLIFDRNDLYRKSLADILLATGHEVHHFSDLASGSELLNFLEPQQLNLLIASNIGADQVALVARQILTRFIGGKAIILWEGNNTSSEYPLSEKELKALGLHFGLVKALPIEAFAYKMLNFQIPTAVEILHSPSDIIEDDGSFKDDNFVQFPIKHIIPGAPILFPVYLRIREGRYLKILSAGDAMSFERISNYCKKGVEYFLINKSDRSYFVRQATKIHLEALEKLNASLFEQTHASINILEHVFQGIHDCGLDAESLKMAEKITNAIEKKIRQDPELVCHLESIEQVSRGPYLHSYLVSLFSLMVLSKLPHSTDSMKADLAMASLLHDVGKGILPPIITQKKSTELNPSQQKIYRRHPQLGSELLAAGTLLGPNVLIAIEQHHEMMDGSGFPRGVKGPAINLLGRVLSLCNEFVHYLESTKQPPKQALIEFTLRSSGLNRFCPDSLSALSSLI